MASKNFLHRLRRLNDAYETVCKPYCQTVGLSVPAFEILMAVARHQGSSTAHHLCAEQNIKPTLMSFHIEKLVQGGYLERQTIDGNRRSIQLVCTPKAAPLVAKGQELSQKYLALVWAGVTAEEREQLQNICQKIDQNVTQIMKEESQC